MPLKPALPRQRGITLIEVLVALVVSALGVLGVLGMQMRTLADTQTGVRRAQAIRLIEDLSERTRVNPNSLGQIQSYVSDWNHAPTPAVDCRTGECSPANLTLYNVEQWKAAVGAVLPLGTAKIFLAQDGGNNSTSQRDRRQLGVMISWRENEKSSDADYKRPIGIGSDGNRYTAACPADKTCHMQFITLSARCAPYFAGGAMVQFFCSHS